MSDLEFQRVEAASGTTETVVIFLHGYGADGADLLGLSGPLAPHMPNTTFIAPNAPEKCVANPFGYQWFPIPWMDGSSPEEAEAGMKRTAADLNQFIDKVLEEEGVTPEKLAIFGFSQGTMMALHVLPRREAAVGGVVGFSGRLMDPESLADEIKSKPPILLVHGDQDDVVPPASLDQASRALAAAEFEVYAHMSPGMAHGIAPDGLEFALQFLKEKLDA